MFDLSRIPALVPAPPGAVVYHRDQNQDGAVIFLDGKARRVAADAARALFESGEVLLAHGAFVAGRLGADPRRPVFDLLELFAFVRHGRTLVPSALGLARALGLETPHTPTRLPEHRD